MILLCVAWSIDWFASHAIEVLLGFDRLGYLLEQFVQVASLEQAIAIHWIPMHWDVTTSSPFADRVVVDAEVFGRLCGVQVFRQFGHGLGLVTLGANSARSIA
jgi:hypothetical protein